MMMPLPQTVPTHFSQTSWKSLTLSLMLLTKDELRLYALFYHGGFRAIAAWLVVFEVWCFWDMCVYIHRYIHTYIYTYIYIYMYLFVV